MADIYGHTKISVRCKDCNVELFRRTDTFKEWSGRCVKCYHANRKINARGKIKKMVDVSCSDCGVNWSKRADMISKWGGRCVSCCHKYKHSTPEQKKKCRDNLLKQRAINPHLYKKVITFGIDHPMWNGGLPKCVDCCKKLSTYTGRRCLKCAAKQRTGENHFNWKGGISCENLADRRSTIYAEWRQSVFKRDNWRCIICNHKSQKKKDIVADHIMPFFKFKDQRFNVDNGRTLCVSCDVVYGYNHNRDKDKIALLNKAIDKYICWGREKCRSVN